MLPIFKYLSLSQNEMLVSKVSSGFVIQVKVGEKGGTHAIENVDDTKEFVAGWLNKVDGEPK